MSRARPIEIEDERVWFDTKRNGERARVDHLELLALVEGIDFDDLLDEHITQGEVIKRLREALGTENIPENIVRRREEWRRERHEAPKCRICGQKGESTKHHFVNKWILRELSSYATKWSDRKRNTIPVCLTCHRNLHQRGGESKSIVRYLLAPERSFVQEALEALGKQRASLFVLLVCGDDSVYESQLLKDYALGHFRSPL